VGVADHRRIGLCALLIAAVLPTCASAAVVDVQTTPGSLLLPASSKLRFQGTPGERNVVTVEGAIGDSRIVRDSAATIVAGPGCTRIDAHAAVCRRPRDSFDFPLGAIVHGGDGDDQLTSTAAGAELRGDAGKDALRGAGRLVGGAGDDTLTGSDGNDRLVGGPGRDRLNGGAGADELVGGNDLFEIGDAVDPASEGSDRIDGGSGQDKVLYHNARAVRVDLTARTGGVRGELDVLRGIEHVEGGPGADTLVGDRRANTLDGGGGRDRLEGGAGADVLDGGPGVDALAGAAGNDVLRAGERMSGGPGNDQIDAIDPIGESGTGTAPRISGGAGDDTIDLLLMPAALDCGPGRDVVDDVLRDRKASLTAVDVDACESVVMAEEALAVATRPRRTPAALIAAVRCPNPAARGKILGCTGSVTLRLLRPGGGARTLGRGTFALPAVARKSIPIALSPAERRLLAGIPRPRIAVDVAVDIATPGDPGGPELVRPHTASWRVRLAA
jgi:Ca2+-binding RTX toxin-like protein